MTEKEIIKGLMLKLKDEDVNCLKLQKRIGKDDFKAWDKAYMAAFDFIEKEK